MSFFRRNRTRLTAVVIASMLMAAIAPLLIGAPEIAITTAVFTAIGLTVTPILAGIIFAAALIATTAIVTGIMARMFLSANKVVENNVPQIILGTQATVIQGIGNPLENNPQPQPTFYERSFGDPTQTIHGMGTATNRYDSKTHELIATGIKDEDGNFNPTQTLRNDTPPTDPNALTPVYKPSF